MDEQELSKDTMPDLQQRLLTMCETNIDEQRSISRKEDEKRGLNAQIKELRNRLDKRSQEIEELIDQIQILRGDKQAPVQNIEEVEDTDTEETEQPEEEQHEVTSGEYTGFSDSTIL